MKTRPCLKMSMPPQHSPISHISNTKQQCSTNVVVTWSLIHTIGIQTLPLPVLEIKPGVSSTTLELRMIGYLQRVEVKSGV